MINLTTAGKEECGATGNLVNWEDAEWTLHSQAKMIEVDWEWEGPCQRESQVKMFMANFQKHEDCMHHCKKIRGRSPSVNTEDCWEHFSMEVDLITPDISDLPPMWLSATEGDKGGFLGSLDHWPETEIVDNETIELKAEETIWRDYYTGQRLDNWTKPYGYLEDTIFGKTSNCIQAFPGKFCCLVWEENGCKSYDTSCPCNSESQIRLILRGLCANSQIDTLFTLKQLPGDPYNMMLLGKISTKIEYADSQWKLTDAKFNMTAASKATKASFVLGRHEWTISGDASEQAVTTFYSNLINK